MNKKQLYESIMKNVSIEVKKALNETEQTKGQNSKKLNESVEEDLPILNDFYDEVSDMFEPHDFWPMPQTMANDIETKLFTNNTFVNNAIKYFTEKTSYYRKECIEIGFDKFENILKEHVANCLDYCVRSLEEEYEEKYSEDYPDAETMFADDNDDKECENLVNLGVKTFQEMWG